MSVTFKKVSHERRSAAPPPSRYEDLWAALEAGHTLELQITQPQAQRIRSAWKGRKKWDTDHKNKTMLRVIADGDVFVAWLDKLT